MHKCEGWRTEEGRDVDIVERLEELERKLWRNLIYRLIATGIDIGVFISWIVCILHTT